MSIATALPYTPSDLRRENACFGGSGGVSQGNCTHGFLPAFLDHVSGRVYRACFANGSPAPMHVLDGLPDALVIRRDARGRVVAVRGGIEAGFVRDGCFYSRQQAAALLG